MSIILKRFKQYKANCRRQIRKCGENRDRPTRPRFCTSATCGFAGKDWVALGGFRFFPALPELQLRIESSCNNNGIRDNIEQSRTHQNVHLNKTRGCPPLGRNPLAKLWPAAGLRFLFKPAYLNCRMSYCEASGIRADFRRTAYW